jgi:hypothetical protein
MDNPGFYQFLRSTPVLAAAILGVPAEEREVKRVFLFA